MTSKKSVDPEEEDSLGVLDDTPSSDTGIGLLSGTAHVAVVLPTGDEDDLVDDEVIDGEVTSDLIIDTSAVADADVVARIQQDSPEIVIELPAETEDVETAERIEDADAQDDPEGHGADEDDEPAAEDAPDAEPVTEAEAASDAEPTPDAEAPAEPEPEAEAEAEAEPEPEQEAEPVASDPSAPVFDTDALSDLESVVAAAKAELREAMSSNPQKTVSTEAAADATAQEKNPVVNEDRAPAARPAAEIARATDDAARRGDEVALTSKRIGEMGGASQRESADLLTADRLLEPSRLSKPEPEGAWSHFLYSASGGLINLGDGRKARERKQLKARIAAHMTGTARFVPVLSRKGGVGKTTVTALLGMALADARDDRVIAVDANPDRGTLAERVVGSQSKSVRDMVRAQDDIRGFHDITALVARDETRLDVLASDSDPRVSEAFGDADYRDVAAIAAQYYSLVLTDSGTGIVHSVMGATLDLADQLIIVSGLSVDEARLASETLTWLETNGHADLARGAIVVLNQSTPGAPLVRLSELESHFSTRAKHVLRIPYDTQIAGGGPIDFSRLQPETRRAAREIAATLVESLRGRDAR